MDRFRIPDIGLMGHGFSAGSFDGARAGEGADGVHAIVRGDPEFPMAESHRHTAAQAS
jgi:hypothetical protein